MSLRVTGVMSRDWPGALAGAVPGSEAMIQDGTLRRHSCRQTGHLPLPDGRRNYTKTKPLRDG